MSKFSAGQMVITPAAQATFDETFVQSCLGRHLAGDWGDLCEKDTADAAHVYPPKNGTPRLFGGECNGVEIIGERS